MLAFLAVWAMIVAFTVLFMARRGHSWFSWAVLSGSLGPLAWPLAVRAVLADKPTAPDPAAAGDVLIAVAPWARSPESVLDAVRQTGSAIRAATLVSVLDAEDATTSGGRVAANEAEDLLARCRRALLSSGLVSGPVEHRLLYGRAADELARLARSGGYRRIVLGESGSALHHLLHGHTRSRLEQLASIPVVPGDPQRVAA